MRLISQSDPPFPELAHLNDVIRIIEPHVREPALNQIYTDTLTAREMGDILAVVLFLTKPQGAHMYGYAPKAPIRRIPCVVRNLKVFTQRRRVNRASKERFNFHEPSPEACLEVKGWVIAPSVGGTTKSLK
jgi:hypothetical protein